MMISVVKMLMMEKLMLLLMEKLMLMMEKLMLMMGKLRLLLMVMISQVQINLVTKR